MKQCTILFLLFTSISIFSQNRDYSIDTFNLKSEILQENRSVIIYKPLSISEYRSCKIHLSSGRRKFELYLSGNQYSFQGFNFKSDSRRYFKSGTKKGHVIYKWC